MRKKKKLKLLRKPKRWMGLGIFAMILLLLTIGLLLENHLFSLQRKERLSKIEDYKTFQLSYLEQNRCQIKEKFTYDNTIFYYDCLEEVYLKYGSTITTLQEVFDKEYLTLKDFLATTREVVHEGEEKTVYYHLQTKDSLGYKVTIETEEDKTKITIAKYLNE